MLRLAGADSVPVPRVTVVLHRVGRQRQGPIDSLPSDRAGRFSFRFRPDTADIFLLSARYAGIEYFSPPVHVNPARPDTALVIVVSDTSTTAPIVVQARHLVVSAPAGDGTRGVLDILVLVNRSDRTRVAPDSLTPTFALRLPGGMLGVQVGQGDISPEAVTIAQDTALIFAPIAPGEKQVVLTYTVPANLPRLRVPFDQPVESANLLLEEESARVEGGRIIKADTESISGRHFRRWNGAVPIGTLVSVRFPGGGLTTWALPGLVGVVGLTLIGAAVLIMRRRAAAPPQDQVPALVEAIARLDAKYLGREGEVSAEEWSQYRAERERLKSTLAARLAAGGSAA